MITRFIKKSAYNVTAAVLGVALAACNADAPTAGPSFSTPQVALARGTATTDPFAPLAPLAPPAVSADIQAVLRAKPLAKDVIATAVIDSRGGSVKVPGTGFELKVPKGAVSVQTTFQVKALAGSIVAYEFEPHGATFGVPLTFSQENKDLAKGTAGLTPLLGYFSSATQLDQSTGSASVGEVAPAMEITDYTGKKLEGNIYHFSGYLVSSGRTAVR